MKLHNRENDLEDLRGHVIFLPSEPKRCPGQPEGVRKCPVITQLLPIMRARANMSRHTQDTGDREIKQVVLLRTLEFSRTAASEAGGVPAGEF